MVSDQAACEKAGGVWVSDGQGGGFCYMKLEGEDIEIEEIPNPDLDWDPFGSSNSSSAHGSDLYVRKKPGRSSDGGGSSTGDAKSGAVDHNSTRSNRAASSGDKGGGGTGGTGDAKSGAVDHNSTRSNRAASSGDKGGGGTAGSGDEKSGAVDHNSTRSNRGVSGDGGSGGTGDAKSGAVDHNSTRSNRGVSGDGGSGGAGDAKSGAINQNDRRFFKSRSGKSATVRPKRPGRTSFGELITKSGKLVTSTVGTAGKAISLALLLVAVAAGGDIYQTIGDATEINLVDHITRTDGQSSEDGSSIEVELGLDIPEMGYIEKRLDVSVHIKILESDPTTEADYTFEYTLGEGERIYEFVLEDLDPVTASKVKAGDPIDIEYSGSVTVVYFGIELAPTTTEIPLDVFTINV